jgi:multidrug efflux pump subunit AcrA (membrane-fusion protein)
MAENTSSAPTANGPGAVPPKPTPRPGRFWWIGFLFARFRFVLILAVIGLAMVKWKVLEGYFEKWAGPTHAAEADSDHEFYCPMHPTVVRPDNKDKCPICFMPLSKRKKGETTDEPLPAGTVSRVQLTPYRAVLAGIRTLPVEFHPLAKKITTVGTVEFNERDLWAVSARVKGRIDKLFVNETGQMVHKNDPLAEIYSPDLMVTVDNLLDARRERNGDLEASARERLRLWGIDDRQIDDIAKAGKRVTHLTIRSRIDGHVLRKSVREGQYVVEGTAMFEVADLSTVWVQAQLYEDDLAFLPSGGHDPHTGRPNFDIPVAAFTRAFPNRAFAGKLSFIFPHVDTETRTLTVRFEIPNPEHELRPGMTATVALKLTPDLLAKTPAGTGLQVDGEKRILAVPESAVIDTGTRQVVYRETLPNTFEGVLVRLGPKMVDSAGAVFFPILSGVSERDAVVAAGSFLLDAETRLNPAMGSIYIGGSGVGSSGGATVRPTTPDDEALKIAAALAKLSPQDRKLAEAQRLCPILHKPLGTMGVPVKLMLNDKPVFLCCKGCIADANAEPEKMLARVQELLRKKPSPQEPPAPAAPSSPVPELSPEHAAEARAHIDELPPADRKAAEAQRLCPIQGKVLGTMGAPIKVDLSGGRSVFVCCRGCIGRAQKDPDGSLEKATESRTLPPILPEGKP